MRLEDPTRSYFLEKRLYSEIKDDIGNLKETWVTVKQITGIVQSYDEDGGGIQGREEMGEQLKGFFIANFEMIPNDSPNYRILEIKRDTTPIKTYYRIKKNNNNLFRANRRNHYEFTLEETRRWG